jgi:site-specific DNA recombinase
LENPRLAGLRAHNGVVVGPAVWEPIISEAEHRRVLALMEERKVSGRRAPRRYLLTGLLRCGRCGNTLYSSAREATRRYVCLSGPDHGGCGRLTIVAGPLEELVAQAVLLRLDTKELADAVAGRSSGDEAIAALSESLSEDREQLAELAAMWAGKQISRGEWLAARQPLETRVKDTELRLARVTRNDALAGLPGNGEELRRQWADLNLTRQHAIVSAVLDHAVIAPTRSHTFDPGRVEPVWRL